VHGAIFVVCIDSRATGSDAVRVAVPIETREGTGTETGADRAAVARIENVRVGTIAFCRVRRRGIAATALACRHAKAEGRCDANGERTPSDDQ
jgi:hypothetical protein